MQSLRIHIVRSPRFVVRYLFLHQFTLLVYLYVLAHLSNTDADMAAKAALAASPDNILVPHSDFRQHIHQ